MPAHIHIFQKYLNRYFIETGSYKGEGIQCALTSGFQFIKSVEIDKERYENCVKKFEGLNGQLQFVELFHGSTEDTLWDMIKDINEPITFWLDAHWSGEGEPMSDKKCPLMVEFDIIKKHPIKTHTIIIDDMRCCNTDYFDFIEKQEIEQRLLEINPNYKLIYEHSWEPNDILVAKI